MSGSGLPVRTWTSTKTTRTNGWSGASGVTSCRISLWSTDSLAYRPELFGQASGRPRSRSPPGRREVGGG